MFIQDICESVVANLTLDFVIFQWTDAEEQALKAPILAKYEKEGSPYYASARFVTNVCCCFSKATEFLR